MKYFNQIDESCALLTSGTVDRREFIELCLLITSGKIGCDRTGLWLFVETSEGRRMKCLGVYDRPLDKLLIDSDRVESDAGEYFDELERIGYVVAADVRTHPATAGFFGHRHVDMGIAAAMTAGISLNGRLFGAFTCTQNEVRHWSGRELAALNKIASRVTLALASASPSQLDTLFGSL